MPSNTIEKVVLFQIEKTGKIAKIYSQKEIDKRGIGITVDQWVVLKIIHENSPISQRELATISFRDPASITRTLDLLEKRSLVSRDRIPENRRQYNVVLTKSGVKFIDKHLPMIKRHREKSLEGFTKKEIKTLNDLLIRVQENMT